MKYSHRFAIKQRKKKKGKKSFWNKHKSIRVKWWISAMWCCCIFHVILCLAHTYLCPMANHIKKEFLFIFSMKKNFKTKKKSWERTALKIFLPLSNALKMKIKHHSLSLFLLFNIHTIVNLLTFFSDIIWNPKSFIQCIMDHSSSNLILIVDYNLI